MGEDDGAGAGRAGGEVGADAVQGAGQHRLVGGRLGIQLVAGQGGLEIGHAVDGDGAVSVLEYDRDGSLRKVGAQVHSGLGQQAGADAEAVRGVVIPTDHDRGYAEVGELLQCVTEQPHRVQARNGPVVDVARYQQRIDVFGSGCGANVVDDLALNIGQIFPVEPAAQMPVRGVQEPHAHRP